MTCALLAYPNYLLNIGMPVGIGIISIFDFVLGVFFTFRYHDIENHFENDLVDVVDINIRSVLGEIDMKLISVLFLGLSLF